MDGGFFAKRGFRYQDYCAVYYALTGFLQESQFKFECIYCEQGKLDFEVWNTSEFNGFQVKTSPNGISAKEVNQIFDKYYKKSVSSKKKNKKFRFIFCESPKNSLLHLLVKLAGNTGVKYGKTTEKYIQTSLENINTEGLKIDHRCYTEEELKAMVISVAGDILKSRIKQNEDYTSFVVYNFIARFREEIDKICIEVLEKDRMYRLVDIETLITNFIATTKFTNYLDEGEKTEIINYSDIKPMRKTIRQEMLGLESPVAVREEGGSIKS